MTAPAQARAPQLRDYQQQAVNSAVTGLRDGGRGQIHMACGTGKTLVAFQVATQLALNGLIAIVCPSISLVSQTLREWGAAGYSGRAFAICYDTDAGDEFGDVTSLPCPTGTDPEHLAAFLRRFPDGPRLLVSTHQSVDRLGAGLVMAHTQADLLIIDEAHHTTGRGAKKIAVIHDDRRVPAARRIYMTATPRYLSSGIAKPGEADGTVVSMDDPSTFGPVLFSYPFSRAIAESWLDDYRLAVVGVTRPDILNLLRSLRPADVTGMDDKPVRETVAQAALAKAASRWDLRRVIVFTPRIADAESFTRTLPRTIAELDDDDRPRGALFAAHVSGLMGLAQRAIPLQRLAAPPDGGWTVVANARCLGEGVDVPAVDGVMFTRPKSSPVEVVQAVGRALRRHVDGTGTATVLIPILLPDDPHDLTDTDDPEWETLWQVVRALRAHDDTFAAELDGQRSKLGGYAEDAEPLRKVSIVLPDGMDQKAIAAALTLRIVQSATSSWWEWYGVARAYRDQHGDLLVSATHVTDSGYRLGQWISRQRGEQRRGYLLPDRVEALDAIGMSWDPNQDRWRNGLALLAAYRTAHGHARVPRDYQTPAGERLGHWVSSCRADRSKGRLSAERIADLDALGMVWEPPPPWQEALDAARTFHAREGHLQVPMKHIEDGVKLGMWVKSARTWPISDELRAALADLGMVWKAYEEKWRRGFEAFVKFQSREGHVRVPRGHVENGLNLNVWVQGRRTDRRRGNLTAERIAALDEVGFPWSSHERTYENSIAAARAFHAREGHLLPHPDHVEAGVWLGAWLTRRRREYRNGELAADRIADLDALGIDWDPGKGPRRLRAERKGAVGC